MYKSISSSLTSFIGSFKWSDQLVIEFKDLLYTNFHDINSVFTYFLTLGEKNQELPLGYDEEIPYANYAKVLNSLSSRRYTKKEMQQIWKAIAQHQDYLTYSDFTNSLNSNKFGKKETGTLR